MVDYTLHSFLESGNSYKPALMLELAQADWQTKWVNFFDGEHRSPEYLAQNSMGEMPLLIDHSEDDLAISQSGVILYHLAEKLGKFGPENAEEEREVMRWILFDNHKLTGYVSVFRFLYKFMGKGDTPEGKFMQGRMINAIKTLNRHLDGRDFAVANRLTIADLSMVGYLYWPDHFAVDWGDFPNIEAWLKRISELPNYKTPEDILPTS